jgi:hypothetical protein
VLPQLVGYILVLNNDQAHYSECDKDDSGQQNSQGS